VRLLKGGREANLRSVVSIMALEVGGGDTVTVVARGADAAEAVSALEALLARAHAPPAAGAPAAVRAVPAAPPPAPLAPPADGSLRGVPASPGVAVGALYVLRHDDAVLEERASDPNHERRALDAAVSSAHLQLEAVQARLATEADPEKAAIFAAHQELLEDPEVLDAAAAAIRGGATAAFAWRQAYVAQAERLSALRSELLAGRATDMRDVGRRVLHLLVGGDSGAHEIPAGSIVAAEDLAPSDAASLDRTRVLGFCTTMGSATSHVAILARGLGIPAVAGIDPRVLDLEAGTRVVLDGDAGTLQLAPSAAEEAAIVERQAVAERRREAEYAVAQQPAVTTDSHRVEVVANIGDVREAVRVPEVGGEGVGLLRSEFLFLDRRTAPDEEEQTRQYSEVARALGPERILVIRTLDVGATSRSPTSRWAPRPTPSSGSAACASRSTATRSSVPQIRAILRASAAGRVAVMFPMISTLAEWRAARASWSGSGRRSGSRRSRSGSWSRRRRRRCWPTCSRARPTSSRSARTTSRSTRSRWTAPTRGSRRRWTRCTRRCCA
jgi:phosphocarrier protein FPr